MGKKERISDALIYKNIFEFMKENGEKPFITFSEDLNELRSGYLDHKTINDRIFYKNKDLLGDLIKKNGKVVEFLRGMEKNFLYTYIMEESFTDFIKRTVASINNIDLFIENAEFLDELGIDTVRDNTARGIKSAIKPDRFGIYYDKSGETSAIVKPFSDSAIDCQIDDRFNDDGVNKFRVFLFNPTWCVVATNTKHFNGNICFQSTAYINDFGFDKSKFPTKEELKSFDTPDCFDKVLKKM